MFEIFNQVDEAPVTSISKPLKGQSASAAIDLTNFDLMPQSVAHLIKNDFSKWHELLCADRNLSQYHSPQEVALVSFDAIASYCLPRVDLHT